jgi:MFS family permease
MTQLFLAATQASFFVYLALYLQEGRGLDPLEAGLVFTILAVAYVAASGPAPTLTERFGRTVVAVGGALLASGLAALAITVGEIGTGGSVLALVPGLVLAGAGIGLCYTPLTSTVLAGVERERAGAASGVLATTQQVGYALGVALTGLLFFGTGAGDVAEAFRVSLLQLAATAAGIVVLARLLPRPAATPRPGGAADSFPAPA